MHRLQALGARATTGYPSPVLTTSGPRTESTSTIVALQMHVHAQECPQRHSRAHQALLVAIHGLPLAQGCIVGMPGVVSGPLGGLCCLVEALLVLSCFCGFKVLPADPKAMFSTQSSTQMPAETVKTVARVPNLVWAADRGLPEAPAVGWYALKRGPVLLTCVDTSASLPARVWSANLTASARKCVPSWFSPMEAFCGWYFCGRSCAGTAYFSETAVRVRNLQQH